jgi:hypothetical protein
MTKISGYSSLTSAAIGDLLVVVDISDTTMAMTGTTKNITLGNIVSYIAQGLTFTGALAPAVSALTDGATIAVNAKLGNIFAVTLGGNRTLSNPTNPVDGQSIKVRITQDGAGSRTLAYGTAYNFGTAGAPTLTTTAAKTDILGFEYVAAKTQWCYLGTAPGF